MILLVTPNIKEECYNTTNKFSAIHPCMDAAILHSYLTHIKKVKCSMVNMEADNIGFEDLVKLVDSEKVKEVWIICSGSNPSASTMTMPAAIQLCKGLKATTNAKVVMYGGHPSVLPDLTKIQSGCDDVIIGDNILCDIKEVPMIDYNLINPNKYRAHNWHCFGDLENRSPYAVVYTSLGCPYSCKFCTVKNLYKTKPFSMRQRRIEDVVKEIVYLNKTFKVRNIRILDELFTFNLERVERFCDLLSKENLVGLNMWCYSRVDTINLNILKKLKGVGVNWVAYGFESYSQETLDLMGKRTNVSKYDSVIKDTREAGINIIADVIAGFPNDNYESLEKTYKFLEDNLFEMINLYPLFNLPGTSLYNKKETDWDCFQLYGNKCTPASTEFLTSSEVLQWRDLAFNKYMTDVRYLDKIESKFGLETRNHLIKMMEKKIR